MSSKDTSKLLKLCRRQGFEVTETNNSHIKVRNPHNGMFTFIGAHPSSVSMKRVRKELIDIGLNLASVAQRKEQGTSNAKVVGLNPTGGAEEEIKVQPQIQVQQHQEKEKEMAKSEWTELVVISEIPSPRGDFTVRFRLMRVPETQELLVDIRKFITKDGNMIPTKDGCTVAADQMGILAESFTNMNEAMEMKKKQDADKAALAAMTEGK